MKILYFTDDFTPENVAFAKAHGLTMRNALAVETGVNLEVCDAWFGEKTPTAYQKKYPEYTLPETDTVPLADYQALQAKLETAKQRIAELEATQTKPKPTKSDKPTE